MLKKTHLPKVCCTLITLALSCHKPPPGDTELKIVGADASDELTTLVRKSTVYLHPVFCTGTFADIGVPEYERRVIITAAHCNSEGPRMKVSKQNLGKNPDAPFVEGNLIAYPQWDQGEVGDIGVVVLDKPAPADWTPVPISSLVPKAGQKVLLAGFGDIKLKGTWPTKALAVHTKIESFRKKTNLIIYKTPDREGAECHGDSGGPMFIQKGDGLELIGATTGGYTGMNPSDECKRSGAYTYVKPYLTWMKKVITEPKAITEPFDDRDKGCLDGGQRYPEGDMYTDEEGVELICKNGEYVQTSKPTQQAISRKN